ncbi:MAG: helix-turn-helix transcriptional regulator [Oscillospiraceae bacterium]|nr:helix-turn-helix transcriptional regulator [Oscillospiraceae bacterium]
MPKYDPKIANAKCISNLLHNIAWLRREFGISKSEMAKLLGIGVGSITKIEQGELPPRMGAHVLLNVREHFGFHPCELLGERFGDEKK